MENLFIKLVDRFVDWVEAECAKRFVFNPDNPPISEEQYRRALEENPNKKAKKSIVYGYGLMCDFRIKDPQAAAEFEADPDAYIAKVHTSQLLKEAAATP